MGIHPVNVAHCPSLEEQILHGINVCVCVCVCVCSFVDGFLFVRMYANDLAVGAKAYDRGGPCIGTTSMLAVGGDS